MTVRDDLFTLPETDSDTDFDTDSKPDSYIVYYAKNCSNCMEYDSDSNTNPQ